MKTMEKIKMKLLSMKSINVIHNIFVSIALLVLVGCGGGGGGGSAPPFDPAAPKSPNDVNLEAAFGEVKTGTSWDIPITLTRIGEQLMLKVDVLPVLPTPFSIVQDKCSSQLVFTSCNFSVRFTPTAAGAFSHSFEVPSDATNKITVNVTGTSVASDSSSSPTPQVKINITSPENKAINVAVNAAITASFSTTMNPATINTDTFTLSGPTGSIPGSVNYSGNIATFVPASNLANNTVYTATITNSVESTADTPIANTSWTFTTVAVISGNPGSPTVQLKFAGPIYEAEDRFGNLSLFGELSNAGNVTASFVKLNCSFFDSSSNLIGADLTYLIGTVIHFKASNITTNTGLKPNDIGAYALLTTFKKTTVARYSCEITHNTFEAVDPQAKLELVGDVKAQKNLSNNLELSGQVTNAGTLGLTFGQVYYVLRDASGSIIDIGFSYIKGETVRLLSGTTTDTGLRVNKFGTFSINTSIPFINYGSYELKYDWDDTDIVDGSLTRTLAPAPQFISPPTLDQRELHILRNRAIQKLELYMQ